MAPLSSLANPCSQVKEELDLADGGSKIFKLIGPALVPQVQPQDFQ